METSEVGTERAFFLEPSDTWRFSLKIPNRFPITCDKYRQPKGRNMLTEVIDKEEHCHYALVDRKFPSEGIHIFKLVEKYRLSAFVWEYVWELKKST